MSNFDKSLYDEKFHLASNLFEKENPQYKVVVKELLAYLKPFLIPVLISIHQEYTSKAEDLDVNNIHSRENLLLFKDVFEGIAMLKPVL